MFDSLTASAALYVEINDAIGNIRCINNENYNINCPDKVQTVLFLSGAG
jgi:hypothetical protein